MQKFLLTFTIIFFANISTITYALEKGSWTLIKNSDWCYIGSLPIKSDLPETKKRGENYILVYKIIGSDENIVQVVLYQHGVRMTGLGSHCRECSSLVLRWDKIIQFAEVELAIGKSDSIFTCRVVVL